MSAKELNIGDYVRTKRGTFDRFITSHTQEGLTWYSFEDKGNMTNPENYIIKSSPNIIDLIELRDIVELFEEDDLDGELTGFYEVLAYTTDRKEIGVRNKDGEIDFYPAENLRGIITYEQITSMEYKIGGKE